MVGIHASPPIEGGPSERPGSAAAARRGARARGARTQPPGTGKSRAVHRPRWVLVARRAHTAVLPGPGEHRSPSGTDHNDHVREGIPA